jgi:hypothetical protein
MIQLDTIQMAFVSSADVVGQADRNPTRITFIDHYTFYEEGIE